MSQDDLQSEQQILAQAEIAVKTCDDEQAELVAALGLISEKLDYKFKDPLNLKRALTHRSYQNKGERFNYERLEYIGDAVLDLAVAHLLTENYPSANEGELSKMRSSLVSTSGLASIAREIGLGTHIRLSKGEVACGGANRESTLADVTEALIGALYLEAGFEIALVCVRKIFAQRLQKVAISDPKTELQEALHKLEMGAPQYNLERVEGPEHEPCFVTAVAVDNNILGRGSGKTKKAAQQEAARQALENLSKKE